MHDPMTFESRLAEAFEAYAADASIQVNSRDLAAAVAQRRQLRPLVLLGRAVAPAWRLALVAALVGLLAFAAVLAAGALRRDDAKPIPAADSRIVVWLPKGGGGASVTLLSGTGSVVSALGLESRGCPQLVGGTNVITTTSFGRMTLQAADGLALDASWPSQPLSTEYTGFERWSPDRRTIALVDMEHGLITVVHLRPQAGTSTKREPAHYGDDGHLADVKDAAFSDDGSLLAVAVGGTSGAIGVHLLRDGDDRLIAALAHAGDASVRLAISGDGERVAVVQSSGSEKPRVAIISVADGALQESSPIETAPVAAYPISWSPDDRLVAIGSGARVVLFDTATRAVTDIGFEFAEGVVASRWTSVGGAPAIALLDLGGHLTIFQSAPTVVERRVKLSGTEAAFSPDGSLVAWLASDPAAVRTRAVWTPGDDQILAGLPANPVASDSGFTPCIDWVQGGGS